MQALAYHKLERKVYCFHEQCKSFITLAHEDGYMVTGNFFMLAVSTQHWHIVLIWIEHRITFMIIHFLINCIPQIKLLLFIVFEDAV